MHGNKKPIAEQEHILQLTDEYTWMGGNVGGLQYLLSKYHFEASTIRSAIDNVMSRHSCTSTYQSALQCEAVLEAALRSLEQSPKPTQ